MIAQRTGRHFAVAKLEHGPGHELLYAGESGGLVYVTTTPDDRRTYPRVASGIVETCLSVNWLQLASPIVLHALRAQTSGTAIETTTSPQCSFRTLPNGQRVYRPSCVVHHEKIRLRGTLFVPRNFPRRVFVNPSDRSTNHSSIRSPARSIRA